MYERALALLKEGAAKLPDNPEVQYHLGMAALMGDTEAAKKSLAAATAASKDFVRKAEARRALAQLK